MISLVCGYPKSAIDRSPQVKLFRFCAETDNYFGLVSVTFQPRYFSVSETWMVDMRSDVEDLRHSST